MQKSMGWMHKDELSKKNMGKPEISENETAGDREMRYSKIKSAHTIDNHTLPIEFDNNHKKKYDVAPLLNKDMFSPLKNPALFKAVKVEQGGYAVVWNSEIDISEYELWRNGKELP
jgi:hypothetical protein